MRQIKVANISIGENQPLVLIAGPCVIESEQLCLRTAARIKEIAVRLGIPYIFKSSFDKANRLSLDSFRGPGLKRGLAVLAKVKQKIKVPVLTDIHFHKELAAVAEVADVIQIPAFLCRQTDIVLAAAKTGRAVNIKKWQFMAPWDILPVAKKAESTGNRKIFITERGVCFGYNNLVSDLRALKIIRDAGYPVVYDATHSIQLPGGKGSCSGGQREFVAGLSRAAVAFGFDGLFLEVHPEPDKALCDGPNMIGLGELKYLLKQVVKIKKALTQG